MLTWPSHSRILNAFKNSNAAKYHLFVWHKATNNRQLHHCNYRMASPLMVQPCTTHAQIHTHTPSLLITRALLKSSRSTSGNNYTFLLSLMGYLWYAMGCNYLRVNVAQELSRWEAIAICSIKTQRKRSSLEQNAPLEQNSKQKCFVQVELQTQSN